MQARYYDPVIGRFYSNDPVGFTGEVDTFNRYAYVANNPYKYIDPDGEEKKGALFRASESIAKSVCKSRCGMAKYYMSPKAQAEYMSRRNSQRLNDNIGKTTTVSGLNKLDKNNHILSKSHINKGVMDLGKNKTEILTGAKDAIVSAAGLGKVQAGSNTIITNINGHKATVRIFVKEGKITSVNVFKGTSDRKGQHKIDLTE